MPRQEFRGIRSQQDSQEQERLLSFLKMQQHRDLLADKLVKVSFIYKGMLPGEEQLLELMRNPKAFIAALTVGQIKQTLKQLQQHFQYEKSKLINPLIIKLDEELADPEPQEQDMAPPGLPRVPRRQCWVLFFEALHHLLDMKMESKIMKAQKLSRVKLHRDYKAEIHSVLFSKTYQQLQQFQLLIESRMAQSQGDEPYWQYILSKAKRHKYLMVLSCFFDDFIRRKAFHEMQRKEKENQSFSASQILLFQSPSPIPVDTTQVIERNWMTVQEDQAILTECRQQILKSQLRRYANVIQVSFGSPKEGMKLQLKETHKGDNQSYAFIAQQILQNEKSRPLGIDEEIFHDEVPVVSNYTWMKKYLSKKPFYTARVKMGFDWTQYNRRHYSTQVQPPKLVQGYKFVIFYPDLVDRSSKPEYELHALQTMQYIILRFRAGPPYLDIGFKVLNKEWDYSKKSGFDNIFNRGILNFSFMFKKPKYKI